jgi:hypothetical protein
MRAFLDACRSFPYNLNQLCAESPNSKWLSSLHRASTWIGFQQTLKLQPVDSQEVIFPNGIELIVKSTTLAAAERLLNDCRRQIQHWHLQKSRVKSSDNPMYINCSQRYMDILKSLKQQNIDIQNLWYDFLIEMLEWELEERGQFPSIES